MSQEKFSQKNYPAEWKIISEIMPKKQIQFLKEIEFSEHTEQMLRLANDYTQMPKLYATKKSYYDATVFLHYFIGGSDWFILEKGTGSDKGLMYCYAVLNGDFMFSELGSVSLDELKQYAELDFYWKKVPLKLALKKAGHPDYADVVEEAPTPTIKEIVKESPNIFIAKPSHGETSTSTSSSEEVEAKDEESLSDQDREIMDRYPVLTKKQLIDIEQKTFSILANPASELTEEDRYTLEQFEGIGGQHTKGDVNSLYQFYTPYIWIKKMWELAYKHGLSTDVPLKVLEPAMGAGRFFKFAPQGSELVGFDPDRTNFEIVKRLYPQANTYQLEFETNFMKESPFDPGIYTGVLSKDLSKVNHGQFDLVIGNPPYGNFTGTYASYFPSFLTRFEILFLYLGIKSLRKGGLLVYIISQNFMNNNLSYNAAKQELLKIADFVDAYRLPNDIFSTTSVGTDIIIFKRK